MNETPDLLVFNGKITTMDAALPETTAFAARHGRFVAVGTDKDVVPLKGKSTIVVDLYGRRVVPGLIGNHMHLIRGGLFYNLELRWDGVRSLAHGMQMLREQVARTPPPHWVRVVGGFTSHQFREIEVPAQLVADISSTFGPGRLSMPGMECRPRSSSRPTPLHRKKRSDPLCPPSWSWNW